jgi:hypothetical protein
MAAIRMSSGNEMSAKPEVSDSSMMAAVISAAAVDDALSPAIVRARGG